MYSKTWMWHLVQYKLYVVCCSSSGTSGIIIAPEISMDQDEARSKNLRLLDVRASCMIICIWLVFKHLVRATCTSILYRTFVFDWFSSCTYTKYRVLILTFGKPNSVAYELCMLYQCSNVVPIFCTNMLYQMLYQIISNSMSLQREISCIGNNFSTPVSYTHLRAHET